MLDPTLKAPFPWFGGKSRIAPLIWQALGDPKLYVEPFFGSGATLLARPADHQGIREVVNDLDGFIANFWRAISQDPQEVARHTDYPVTEVDLHARHLWLVNHRELLTEKLQANPEFYDPMVAGWWLWGISTWIGGNWCSGQGPWRNVDDRLQKAGHGPGIRKQLPIITCNNGVHALPPATRKAAGWAVALAARLRNVKVTSGDWHRVMRTAETARVSAGILLDPPYGSTSGRTADVYACDSGAVAKKVHEWCLEHGSNLKLRIALCGYEDEHPMPDTWQCVAWTAHGGHGRKADMQAKENASRERVWFSPGCNRL